MKLSKEAIGHTAESSKAYCCVPSNDMNISPPKTVHTHQLNEGLGRNELWLPVFGIAHQNKRACNCRSDAGTLCLYAVPQILPGATALCCLSGLISFTWCVFQDFLIRSVRHVQASSLRIGRGNTTPACAFVCQGDSISRVAVTK